MAEIYKFRRQGKEPLGRSVSLQAIGYDFMTILLEQDDRESGRAAETSARDRAARKEAELYFPEMESIAGMLTDARKRPEQASRKEDDELRSAFLCLSDAADAVNVQRFTFEDPDEERLSDTGRAYLDVRDMLSPGKGERDPSTEQLAELDALRKEADKEQENREKARIRRENGKHGWVFQAARKLIDNSGIDSDTFDRAISLFRDADHDNTKDAALWKTVTECLDGQLRFGQNRDKATRQAEKDIRFALKKTNPEVARFFVYQCNMLLAREQEEQTGTFEARRLEFDGKDAEKHVRRRINNAQNEVREDYSREDLILFAAMDLVERTYFLGLSRVPNNGIPGKVRSDNVAWHLIFFQLYADIIRNEGPGRKKTDRHRNP